MPTSSELRSLSVKVLQLPALEPALRPVLGLLRLELKRMGLTLGAELARDPVHAPAGDYSRREWRYPLKDTAHDTEGFCRDVVLALELTGRGVGEGCATLLVEERPQELSAFDWSKRCRSRRLLGTPSISCWWGLPDPLEGLQAVFALSGLLDPLQAVRGDVLAFVLDFQP